MSKSKKAKIEFTASSGNRAELSIEWSGPMMAVEVNWEREQSPEDMAECNRWFPEHMASLEPRVTLVETKAVIVDTPAEGEAIRKRFLKAGDQ